MDRAVYRGSLAFYWAAQPWEMTSKEEIKRPLGILRGSSHWLYPTGSLATQVSFLGQKAGRKKWKVYLEGQMEETAND